MLISRRKKRRCERDDDSAAEGDGDVCSDGVRVYFYDEVSRSSVLRLVKCLREATTCSQRDGHSDGCVYLHINSDGGDAFAGMAAHDYIKNNPIPVVTIASGMVASAASFMLLGAQKRMAFRHSFIRIHQVSITGFDGKYVDLVDEMSNTHSLMNMMKEIYADNTKISETQLDEILKKEIDMDANQCLENGLVHSII